VSADVGVGQHEVSAGPVDLALLGEVDSAAIAGACPREPR
jgi:hypothetical protein